MTTACLTSYTASMLLLLGSALLVSQIPGLGFKPKVEQTNTNQNWSNISSFNSENFITQNWYKTPPANLNNFELKSNNTFSNILMPNSLVHNKKHFFTELPSQQDEFYIHVRVISNKLFNNSFNSTKTVWDWTDVIINYVLMNSVSSILFTAKDF